MPASPAFDLQELSVDRSRADFREIAPRRHLMARVVLPLALLGLFVVVTAWAARESLTRRHAVTVVPVSVGRVAAQQAGTPLFKAAGWVEPRPTPIRVPVLTSGIVKKLHVVEDQAVKAGDLIAELVDEDARLAVATATANCAQARAMVAEVEGALQAAKTHFEIPTALQIELAEAESALAVVETELATLPKQLARAIAQRDVARISFETKQKAKGAVSALVVQQAQAEWDAAAAQVEELEQRRPRLEEQRKAAEARRAAVAKRLELKTDERRAVAEAEAKLNAAQAQRQAADTALAEARLRLKRMSIHAPMDGRVLNLAAYPGAALSVGMSPQTGEDAATVVTMYQPDRLQVRVDVRFEDLPHVGRDQEVVIHNAVSARPLHGRVLFLTGYANIQKNTLGVKVSLDDAPDTLKPEMLVEVTFLAKPVKASSGSSGDEFRILVPAQLLEGEGDRRTMWIADQSRGVARRVAVSVGASQPGGLIEVTAGLTPASRLIVTGREGLTENLPIVVTGEDSMLGRAIEPNEPHGMEPDSR